MSSNSSTFKVSSVRSIILPLCLWNLCDHVLGKLHLLAVSEVIISGDLHTPGHIVHVHCAAEESMSRPRDFKLSVYQVLKVRSSAQFYTLINIFFWKCRILWVTWPLGFPSLTNQSVPCTHPSPRTFSFSSAARRPLHLIGRLVSSFSPLRASRIAVKCMMGCYTTCYSGFVGNLWLLELLLSIERLNDRSGVEWPESGHSTFIHKYMQTINPTES